MNVADGVILIAEDNPTDVLLTQRALAEAKLPYLPRVLPDGQETVAYLSGRGPYADRSHHPLPTLVVLDLKLPRMSGLDVLAWMRSQAELRQIPVVVLTRSKRSADVNRAYDLGANAYLVKPVRSDALLRVVETLTLYLTTREEPAPHESGETPRSAGSQLPAKGPPDGEPRR